LEGSKEDRIRDLLKGFQRFQGKEAIDSKSHCVGNYHFTKGKGHERTTSATPGGKGEGGVSLSRDGKMSSSAYLRPVANNTKGMDRGGQGGNLFLPDSYR